MSQLFPEVIDGSTLGQRVSQPVYLPIGIEGHADDDGDATAHQVYEIQSPADAAGHFGTASVLTGALNTLLDRGATLVYAAAAVVGDDAPVLTDRQAAWLNLEAHSKVRIRLTDSLAQADLVALATSCDHANLLNNKQFALGGMAAGTTKSGLITAAGAIASKRFCLVGPGVYDENGVLQSGGFASRCIAALVAQNNDPSDDLDTLTIPKLTGMEMDTAGNDLFRQTVVSGSVVNSFEDLLQAGVSPVMPAVTQDAGLAISHLRMTYTTDNTFDALMTRIIMDQLFILIRDYAMQFNALRKGNTPKTRRQLQSGIEALMKANDDIVQPVTQPDNTLGYGVSVTSAPGTDRQQVISYQGNIVRGTQTILVNGNLTISA